MVINEKEFPMVVQAYQTADNQDLFVAEQVVHTQHEVDNFTSRYTGLLIKARPLNENELQTGPRQVKARRRASSGSSAVWLILLLLIIALVVVGFTTGWIQRTFNIHLGWLQSIMVYRF